MATRLYPTTKRPGTRIRRAGGFAGNWNPVDCGGISPWSTRSPVYEASTSKTDGGAKRDVYFYIDHGHNASWGTTIFSWVSPPFTGAGTLSGTFNLCFFVGMRWDHPSGQTLDAHGQWMVTISVIRANGIDSAGVALANYIDATDLFKAVGSGQWQSLTAAATLSAVNYAAGDRILIELGFHISSIPAHTDTYPPGHAADLWFFSAGVLSGDTDATAGGITTTGFNGWFEFSQTLTFAGLPSSPPNTTCATAVIIPSALPQTMARIDTTGSTGATEREVFYRWTCPTPALGLKVFATFFGSNYALDLEVFRGDCGSLVPAGALKSNGFTASALWAPTPGETYTIRVRNQTSAIQATKSGGSLEVRLQWRLLPAEGDLILSGGPHLVSFRGDTGQMVNYGKMPGSVTGIAIDYSKTPIEDLNGGLHEGERILVALHSTNLVEIFDLPTFSYGDGQFEVDYYDDTSFGIGVNPVIHPGMLAVRPNGDVYVGWFGNGYLHVEGFSTSGRGSAFFSTVMNAVSSDPNFVKVRRIKNTEAVNGASPGTSVNITVALEKYAPWAIAIDEAAGILYYTTGSIYSYLNYSEFPSAGLDVNAARKVQRYNIGTGLQLPDILVPNVTDAFAGVRGVQIGQGGNLLVAAGNKVILMNTAGQFIREYLTNDADQGYDLETVKMSPRGDFVYAVEEMSNKVFKWDYATGTLVASWETDLFLNTVTQLEIYSHVCECCVDTQLDISNKALYKVGVSKVIQALDENSREAVTCAALYLDAIKETFRRHPWAFATKYADSTENLAGYFQLVHDAVNDPHQAIFDDWLYAYQYPVDCIDARRIVPKKGDGSGRDFDRDPIPFRVGMKWNADTSQNVKLVFTNEADAVLEYTAFLTCAKDFSDPLFLDAVSWRLASKIAPSMSRIAKMALTCESMFERAISLAEVVDRTEAQDRKHGDAEWIEDR